MIIPKNIFSVLLILESEKGQEKKEYYQPGTFVYTLKNNDYTIERKERSIIINNSAKTLTIDKICYHKEGAKINPLTDPYG